MAKVTDQPETIVDRIQLMKLLYRYKGLLEWELSYLSKLPDETVSLALPPTPVAMSVKSAPATKADPGDDSGKKADPGSGSGESEPTAAMMQGGRLESACRYNIATIETYTDLVDTATPYVRALADE